MAGVIAHAVQQAWSNFLGGIEAFLPRVLAMLSIVIVGWLIAMILRIGTRKLLVWVRFHVVSERTGLAPLLKTVELPPAEALVASGVFWVVWAAFLLSGVDVLGFAALRGLIDGFLLLVPRLLVAAAILAAGVLAANFVWRATLLAAVNAHLPMARPISAAVRFLILVLAAAMALEHVAVAKSVVLTAFAIAFGAVMLALAIAFGIGGGSVAKRLLENQFLDREKGQSDDLPHV